MQKYNNDNSQKFKINQADQTKSNIKNHIIKTYQELTKGKNYIVVKELEKWLNKILNNINTEMEKLSNYILKIKEDTNINTNLINNKNEFKIESNSELNIFTSKDIQEENKEITRNFQNETYNYMNINEKTENENAANFLRYVAQISRISYNTSLKLLKNMEEKFIKKKGHKISFEDENIKKEFSFWIKTTEKENQINEKNKFKEYEIILNQENPFENAQNTKQYKYLLNLYYDLSLMYFHCHIAFPLVQIVFKTEEDFNSEKMIDFINRGKNRKVNFVILPALISNGSFLQNGKYWVFTFCKNTFKFEHEMIESLNDLLDIEDNNIKYIKNNLQIEVFCKDKINGNGKIVDIITNIDIPKDNKFGIVFHFFDKKEKKAFNHIINSKQFEIKKNVEIILYEVKYEGNTIISSKDIKHK